jgi:formamidopyrimidine-DNA glycosylase
VPELPEVEHLAQQLRAAIVGRTVERVQARRRGMLNIPPDEASARLRGLVRGVERRAKEVVVRGERASAWLHLGLGGRARLADAAEAEGAPGALVFGDGGALLLEDVFMGHLHVLSPDETEARWQRSGPEPLASAFDARALAQALAQKGRASLKAALVDQACLAGIGNLYADEALLIARLHPLRRAGSLTDDECARLHAALCQILREAIAAGGEEGYVDLHGTPGRYRPRIHRQPRCGRCGSATQALRVSGRMTTVCPACQPAPDGARDA